MVHALRFSNENSDVIYPNFSKDTAVELTLQLPDAADEKISESDFLKQVETAWQVCDRFDLQTDIWRGRILRTVRDREKQRGDGRGVGFLNWLKDQEISKTQAYSLIELANSADTLLEGGVLEPEDVNHFSKRAFIETAQSAPEVQQLVGDRIREAEEADNSPRITHREVKRLSDEWTAMTSELLPIEIREKAADNTIPVRYLTPLVRELEKLPDSHQTFLRQEVADSPDVDTVKQVTAEAHYLAKYLSAAVQVQAINTEALDVEMALEESLRIGCLNSTAELVNQAAQLEQTVAKLYTTWRRVNSLAERVYLDSGASTPQLRSLLAHLNPLTQATLQVTIGDASNARTIQLTIATDEE